MRASCTRRISARIRLRSSRRWNSTIRPRPGNRPTIRGRRRPRLSRRLSRATENLILLMRAGWGIFLRTCLRDAGAGGTTAGLANLSNDRGGGLGRVWGLEDRTADDEVCGSGGDGFFWSEDASLVVEAEAHPVAKRRRQGWGTRANGRADSGGDDGEVVA